jgi:hypothetical protein
VYSNTPAIIVPFSIDIQQCTLPLVTVTSSAALSSRSGNLVAQYFQWPLTFYQIFSKIVETIRPETKSKADVKIGLTNER